MKKILSLSLSLLALTQTKAQDFLGISTGNYAGITGVHIQPASIADSRYQFDLNLTSFSLGYKSNFVAFDRSYAVNQRFKLNGFNDFYDFRKKALSKVVLADGQKGYADITNTVQIPMSFMLTTSKKSAIALNIRSRTAFAMQNLPSQMTDLLFDIQPTTTVFNKAMNADGLSIRGVSWLDVGATYARVLVNSGQHFIKAGVTGKYIGGLSSAYLIADKLNVYAASPDSVYLNSNNTYVQYGHSPTNFNVRPENFRPDASSFGFDAGVVYEFRGRISNFTMGKYNDAGEVVTKQRRDKNKYTFRLGASILDAGTMTFTSADKAKDFKVANGYNFNNTGINSVETFDNFVSSKISAYDPNAKTTHSIALPTVYNLQADLHILKGLYVNGMMQKAFTQLNSGTTFRTYTPEFIAVTPRFETRAFGLYVPFVQNNQKDWNIGTSLRLGPVFVGTNNLATLFKTTAIQEADIHAGLKLPLGFGRPSKTFEKLKNLRKQITADTVVETNTVLINKAEEKITNNSIVVDNTKIAELEAKLADAEAKLKIATANMTNAEMAEKLAEAEAKLKAAQLEMEAAKKAETKKPAAATTNNTDSKPTQIIINNYNSPVGAPHQTINVDENGAQDIDAQIEELRKKIELKEKLLKELKNKDNTSGCIELKKKWLM